MPKLQASRSTKRRSVLSAVILLYVLILSVFGAAEVIWGARGFVLAVSAMLFSPMAVASGALTGWRTLPPLVRAGMALFIVLCLAQLVPLPPALWTAVPGSEKRIAVLAITGMPNAWMPLTLTPIASLYGTLMAISMVILICGLVELPWREFRVIATLTLCMVIVGIAIGVVQVTSGGHIFAFYKATDAGALVGFYANKNHMALAMVCSVALAYMISSGSGIAATRSRVAFLGYWALIALSVPLTNSRAGILIGLVVSVIVAWPLLASVGARAKLGGVVAVAVIGVTLFFAPLPASLVARMDSVGDDLRWPMLLHSFDVWRIYWLFGSGLGSFSDVFMTYEKLDWLFATYVNNVHNDYVQLGIEMGAFGLVALVLFSAGLVGVVPSALRAGSSGARAAAVAGLAIAIAFLLHSIADYPMRRPAALLIFVVGVAALCRAGAAEAWVSDHKGPPLDGLSLPEQR